MTITRIVCALTLSLALAAPTAALAGTDTGNPAPGNEGPYGLWLLLTGEGNEGPYGMRSDANEGPYGIDEILKCTFHRTPACEEWMAAKAE